jgi:hypothetical protein
MVGLHQINELFFILYKYLPSLQSHVLSERIVHPRLKGFFLVLNSIWKAGIYINSNIDSFIQNPKSYLFECLLTIEDG